MNKLLAPNGKKSNLTPEQYALVRTPAFKAWFGDWENSPETASKVVDENGEPLPVYHGTMAEPFAIFYDGSFFTDDYWNAEGYASGEMVYEVFLNIKKPLIINARGRKWDNLKNKYGSSTREIVSNLDVDKYDGVIFININDNWFDDEIGGTQNVYFTTHATQIKLADGSNTTFDGSNPDIRFEEGGVLDSLNPTGSVFADYSAEQIDKLPLGQNITTYDKTAGLKPEQQVTVYRGVPAGVTQIVSGDFITTNKQLAKDYAGIDNVISMIVRADEILDDITEPLGEEYILRLHTPRYSHGGLIHSLKRILPKRILKLSDLPF
jgi:hypothetical protein